MQRRHRLRSRERFQQVRRKGKSRKDPLAVLVFLQNDLPYSRFGFTASRRVGNAVRRNRAKRLLRESVRLRLKTIKPGWDMVFIARPAIVNQPFQRVDTACERLLKNAHMLKSPVTASLEMDEIS